MTTDGTTTNTNGLLDKLSANDRERLGEALRRLLTSGSILGLEPAQTDLYHWCYQNRDWVDEMAGLLDLKLHWEHQDRTVQAVPQRDVYKRQGCNCANCCSRTSAVEMPLIFFARL